MTFWFLRSVRLWIWDSCPQTHAHVYDEARIRPALAKGKRWSRRKWKWVYEGPGALLLFRGIIGCDSEVGEKPQALGCRVLWIICNSNGMWPEPKCCWKRLVQSHHCPQSPELAPGWGEKFLLASAFQRNTGMVQRQHFQFSFPLLFAGSSLFS